MYRQCANRWRWYNYDIWWTMEESYHTCFIFSCHDFFYLSFDWNIIKSMYRRFNSNYFKQINIRSFLFNFFSSRMLDTQCDSVQFKNKNGLFVRWLLLTRWFHFLCLPLFVISLVYLNRPMSIYFLLFHELVIWCIFLLYFLYF